MSTNQQPEPKCLLCDEPAKEHHHLTGKSPDSTYLDPELTVPLCGPHHHHIHADLRSQRINTPPLNVPWSALTETEFCSQRIATFAGRAGRVLEEELLEAVAESLRRLSDDIAEFRQDLDEAFPNWESVINPPKEPTA